MSPEQSDEELVAALEGLVSDYLARDAYPLAEEAISIATMHTQLQRRAFAVRGSLWRLTLRVGKNDRLLAIALRCLALNDESVGGYAVVYLASHYPLELAAHCSLQQKRWWFPEIGYSKEQSIPALVARTAEGLLLIGRKHEAVELMLFLRTLDPYALPGDFDPWDSSGLLVDAEGMEDQKLSLASMEKGHNNSLLRILRAVGPRTAES